MSYATFTPKSLKRVTDLTRGDLIKVEHNTYARVFSVYPVTGKPGHVEILTRDSYNRPEFVTHPENVKVWTFIVNTPDEFED